MSVPRADFSPEEWHRRRARACLVPTLLLAAIDGDPATLRVDARAVTCDLGRSVLVAGYASCARPPRRTRWRSPASEA